MTFKEYKPGEKPAVMEKTCPVCGKVIQSMYPTQLEHNFFIHMLTHKGVVPRKARKGKPEKTLQLPLGESEEE